MLNKIWLTRLGESNMGCEGKGTIFRRKDDRYMLYLPVRLVDDSMFPLKCDGSMPVKVRFNPKDNKLIVEKWAEPENKEE